MDIPMFVVAVLLFFGTWFAFTKQGRARLKTITSKMTSLMIMLVFVLLAGTIIFLVWITIPTDPDVVGRQLHKIAPLGTAVSIDGYSISVDRPATFRATHRSAGGEFRSYSTLTIHDVSITCELDESEKCPTPLGMQLALPKKYGAYYSFEDSFVEAINREGLQGGKTIEGSLSPYQLFSGEGPETDGMYLLVISPEGRSEYSKHKAYLDLGH